MYIKMNYLCKCPFSHQIKIQDAIKGNNYRIEKTSEKAILIKFYSGYGTVVKWIPKNVILGTVKGYNNEKVY